MTVACAWCGRRTGAKCDVCAGGLRWRLLRWAWCRVCRRWRGRAVGGVTHTICRRCQKEVLGPVESSRQFTIR